MTIISYLGDWSNMLLGKSSFPKLEYLCVHTTEMKLDNEKEKTGKNISCSNVKIVIKPCWVRWDTTQERNLGFKL
jgi:hypothetical protein